MEQLSKELDIPENKLKVIHNVFTALFVSTIHYYKESSNVKLKKDHKNKTSYRNKDVYFDFMVRVFDWYSFFTLGLVPKQARPLAPEDERQRPPGSPLHGLLPDDVAHVKFWVHGPHDAPAYVPRTGGSWPFCPSWSTHFTIDYVTESETELTGDPTPPNTRALSPVHASVPLWNVFTVLLQLIVNFKRVL